MGLIVDPQVKADPDLGLRIPYKGINQLQYRSFSKKIIAVTIYFAFHPSLSLKIFRLQNTGMGKVSRQRLNFFGRSGSSKRSQYGSGFWIQIRIQDLHDYHEEKIRY